MNANTKQLADASGISQRGILRAREEGYLIRENDSRYFDLDNSINSDWCRRHGVNPKDCSSIRTDKKEIDSSELDDIAISEITGVPAQLLNMSVRELIKKYGDLKELKTMVDIYYKLMQANKYDVETQIKRGVLLPIEAFEAVQSYNQLLIKQLMDYSESVINDIIPAIKTDEEKAKIDIPIKMKNDFEKLCKEAAKKIRKEIRKIQIKSKQQIDDNQEEVRK